MNRDRYNDAWTKLLAARRCGDVHLIKLCAQRLAQEADLMFAASIHNQDNLPCSHFMVANGHCINCHEPVGRAFCDHTFDSRGVCNACGYNASQG